MALDAKSSRVAHAALNVLLILLSWSLIPITTICIAFAWAVRHDNGRICSLDNRDGGQTQNNPKPKARRVLITGVGMSKGLALARLFHAAGHEVHGADFEPPHLPTCSGRVSAALKAFHKLRAPGSACDSSSRYTQDLLGIIERNDIELWVSCSGVMTALDDGHASDAIRKATSCKTIQFGADMIKKLHEKDAFMRFTQSIGLAVPETHHVTSHEQAISILDAVRAQDKKFIMKFVGTDDAVRANMTLLPFASPQETARYVGSLPISSTRPWILQEYISGPEFCTHAVIVRNQVKAFVACPSAELLMHYTALPASSRLSRSMLHWTQKFAASCPEDFTGHLSFDFMIRSQDLDIIRDAAARKGGRHDEIPLCPIECNPRAHTAVTLFEGSPSVISDAYLAVFDVADPKTSTTSDGLDVEPVSPVDSSPSRYWLPHDIIILTLLPLLDVVMNPLEIRQNLSRLNFELKVLYTHMRYWGEGTYSVQDPLPAWWLWHISWPWQFFCALVTGKKWSRVNVSTMKMFEC